MKKKLLMYVFLIVAIVSLPSVFSQTTKTTTTIPSTADVVSSMITSGFSPNSPNTLTKQVSSNVYQAKIFSTNRFIKDSNGNYIDYMANATFTYSADNSIIYAILGNKYQFKPFILIGNNSYSIQDATTNFKGFQFIPSVINIYNYKYSFNITMPAEMFKDYKPALYLAFTLPDKCIPEKYVLDCNTVKFDFSDIAKKYDVTLYDNKMIASGLTEGINYLDPTLNFTGVNATGKRGIYRGRGLNKYDGSGCTASVWSSTLKTAWGPLSSDCGETHFYLAVNSTAVLPYGITIQDATLNLYSAAGPTAGDLRIRVRGCNQTQEKTTTANSCGNIMTIMKDALLPTSGWYAIANMSNVLNQSYLGHTNPINKVGKHSNVSYQIGQGTGTQTNSADYTVTSLGSSTEPYLLVTYRISDNKAAKAYNKTNNLSTINVYNKPYRFSVKWNDSQPYNGVTTIGELNKVYFETNITGTIKNYTLDLTKYSSSHFYNVTNYTKVKTTRFYWKFYANDSVGNWNKTSLKNGTVDKTAPARYSYGIKYLSVITDLNQRFYANITDNVAPSCLFFQMNDTNSRTGAKSNLTTCSMTNKANTTILQSYSYVNGSSNAFQLMKLFFNDTSGNWNSTANKHNFTIVLTGGGGDVVIIGGGGGGGGGGISPKALGVPCTSNSECASLLCVPQVNSTSVCGLSLCGNNICDTGETLNSCSADCAAITSIIQSGFGGAAGFALFLLLGGTAYFLFKPKKKPVRRTSEKTAK